MKNLKVIHAAFALTCLTFQAGCAPAAPPTEAPLPTASPGETPLPAHTPETPTEVPMSDSAVTGGANADVLFVRAVREGDGRWTFHVTVSHPDTGWEDYADGWDVLTPDGAAIKPDPDSPFTRLLLHPHENEQPFTRSQSGIEIPEGVTEVTVRAHDIVDGFGGAEVVVDLTAAEGPGFAVER